MIALIFVPILEIVGLSSVLLTFISMYSYIYLSCVGARCSWDSEDDEKLS
jgi:hypothetical protein